MLVAKSALPLLNGVIQTVVKKVNHTVKVFETKISYYFYSAMDTELAHLLSHTEGVQRGRAHHRSVELRDQRGVLLSLFYLLLLFKSKHM